MALKYVASNTTYDFGKSEYTTTSNKYKRLNYIANGRTYQIGLATDSTATQYSPLKMKINDSTYYIGRSSSRSTSNSYVSTYSSRYLARSTTYTDISLSKRWTDATITKNGGIQEVYTTTEIIIFVIKTSSKYSTTTISSSTSSVTSMASNNFV